MNEAEAQFGHKFVRRFFSHIYDEWVTGVDCTEVPTVNACTCRALSAAIGSDSFETVLKSLAADQRIAVVCRFEKAEPDAVAVKLLDYSV